QSTVALIVDMPHPDLDHLRRNLRVLCHREHVRLLSLRRLLDCLPGKPRYGFHRRPTRPDLPPVESDAPPAVPCRPHDAVVGVAPAPAVVFVPAGGGQVLTLDPAQAGGGHGATSGANASRTSRRNAAT